MAKTETSCIIAVHAGAGYHSKGKELLYKQLCSDACCKVMQFLEHGGSAVEAVTKAVQILEDSHLTNAGTGSCLTMTGDVECDASVMDGRTLMFGAVGALSGIKNPVCVARRLVEEQNKGSMSLGRVAPCTLVGEGAKDWAKQYGIPCTDQESLKTESSMKTYENHKRRLENAEERRKNKRLKYMQETSDSKVSGSSTTSCDSYPNASDCITANVCNNEAHSQDRCAVDCNTDGDRDKCGTNVDSGYVQDTVGAVCIDSQGNMAAAVSSGGISLKQPGRLGPAALYCAGCWASNYKQPGTPGVAVVTSGTGEHLMKTLLARECARCLQTEDWPEQALKTTLSSYFLDSDVLKHYPEKYAGVLAIRMDGDQQEIVWGHTTESMCIGFMRSSSKVRTAVSRLDDQQIPGKTFIMQGHKL